MSYDLTVYVRREQLPSAAQLHERLRKRGIEVDVADLEDFTKARGFFPVALRGVSTGFELYGDAISDEARDTYRRLLVRDGVEIDERMEILMACDLELSFACRASDESELEAMQIMAKAIAAAAGGWLDDPYTGDITSYTDRSAHRGVP